MAGTTSRTDLMVILNSRRMYAASTRRVSKPIRSASCTGSAAFSSGGRMFVGHFGLGFAAKRIAPQVSLGSLFLSVEFADGLWPIFLLAGIEHVRIAPGLMKASSVDLYDYPWSHSLVA